MLLMSIKCQGVPSLLFIKIWGKDTYFCSRPLLKPKEHERDNTCVYPKRSPMRIGAALQAVSAKPHLTLAMPAVIALFAPLLVHHRVTAALWAQIPRDAHMTHAQWAGCLDALCMVGIFAIGDVRVRACLLLRLLLLHLVEMHLQCLCHRIRERTNLLHAKADRTAAANAAMSLPAFPTLTNTSNGPCSSLLIVMLILPSGALTWRV